MHSYQQQQQQQQYQQHHRDMNDRGSSRVRKYKKELEVSRSTESFRDIGGMDGTLKELCEMLIHIKSPEFYFQLGLLPSRGILLHGPPGCGKTYLARAIAGVSNRRVLLKLILQMLFLIFSTAIKDASA